MWEDIWAAILVVFVVSSVSLGLYTLTQDHTVKMYYLGNGYSLCGFTIKASVNWSQDLDVFVTDDIDKAQRVLVQLNSTLKK